MPECAHLQLGQRVPDFEIETYEPSTGDAGRFSLASQVSKKRWTVLFFYPADFTSICASEFAALAEQHERFVAMGVDVVTVSTDKTATHQAWREHARELATVRYPMGADPAGGLSRLFGVYDVRSGAALRGTFIIDPAGTLLGSEVNFYNLGRNIDELARKLEANLYLAGAPGSACPSKWRAPGGPGPQAV